MTHHREPLQPLPHPVLVLDDSPQLVRCVEEMEAGTYPKPDLDHAIWREDLPRDLCIRIARLTGATDEQISGMD
jgi:hypothetical protein